MNIRKSDGSDQKFSHEKFVRGLRRAQVSDETIEVLAREVNKMIRPGTSTNEIFQRTLHMLEEMDPVGAARYNLKRAMMQLGPSGFPFEQYFSKLMEAYGWSTQVGIDIQGQCVVHEVDIFAERRDEKRAVETKYHNHPGVRTDIKVVMYVHARHMDLAKRDPRIKGVIVTNTEFTHNAIQYGECNRLTMKAWNYPKDDGLSKYIEAKHLYPITVFSRIPRKVINRLTHDGIVLANQLCDIGTDAAAAYGLKPSHYTVLETSARQLCAI